MSGIRIIAGLGNPGREYEDTRHNAGFWWADELVRDKGLAWARETKFFGHIARWRGDAGDVFLLKPQTFMNLSGKAVAALAQFYRVESNQVLVVHDELDLPPGGIKLKLGGGSGGHNGLKDIEATLGTREFWRLRLGIGHPRDWAERFGADAPEVVDYVLHAPSRDELQAIKGAMEKSLALVLLLLEGQMEKAMMRLHSVPKNAQPEGKIALPEKKPESPEK
jgi:peptidyl-tRNA hydrolase, PTH1 family